MTVLNKNDLWQAEPLYARITLISLLLLLSCLPARAQHVGIGTHDPQDPLHLIGNLRLSGGRLIFANTGGSVIIGEDAGLNDNYTANNNVLIGSQAGRLLIDGGLNVAIGHKALAEALNPVGTVAIGYNTLSSPSLTGNNNVAIGMTALQNNTTGGMNVGVGTGALFANTTGGSNAGFGFNSLLENQTGVNNTAIGSNALRLLISGNNNTAIGVNAGNSNLGHANTFIGINAGYNNVNGLNNVFIGSHAGYEETGSNKLYIANSPTTTPLIYGDFLKKKLTVNDTLSTKNFQIIQGAAAGFILKSDQHGRATWADPSSISFWSVLGNHIYKNNPGNVGIGTTMPDEKLHVTGNINVDAGRITMSNNGLSVFIGKEAGMLDDLSDNRNVMIGYAAGKTNTSGTDNVALGANAFSGATASNFTVAIGKDALSSPGLTGSRNTAVGYNTLKSNTSGDFNIAIGASSMGTNTTGSGNVAIGTATLLDNTTGYSNVAIGRNTLTFQTTGYENTAVGFQSGFSLTTGTRNVYFGTNAGWNSNGINNTMIGAQAGQYSGGGNANVFLGYQAGANETGSHKLYISNSNTSAPLLYGEFDKNRLTIHDTLITKTLKVNGGKVTFTNTGRSVLIGEEAGINDDFTDNQNVYIGYQSGKSSTVSQQNIAIGSGALKNNLSGNVNVAIGQNALGDAVFSVGNVAIGTNALKQNTGLSNVAVGLSAGRTNAAGVNNTFIGTNAGENNLGEYNVFLGAYAGINETGSHTLYIGSDPGGVPLIYGEFQAKRTGINTTAPKSTFEVAGSTGATFKNGQIAGTNHPDANGTYWRYTTGTGTITLPAASGCANRVYTIVNHTGGARSITAYTDLNNSASTLIPNNSSTTVVSDGNGWFQMK